MRLSLRARVLVAVALVGAVVVVAAVAVAATTEGHLVHQIDERLAASARDDAIAAGLVALDPPPADGAAADLYEALVVGGGLVTLQHSRHGRKVERRPAPALDPGAAGRLAARRGTATVGAADGSDLRYRVRARELPDGRVYVAALPLDDVDETMRRLVALQAAAAAVVVAVLAAVASWVLRLGIGPIRRMTRSAERIAAGELTWDGASASPSTEAGQLGVALERMVDRLVSSMREVAASRDRLRRFVDDASHELRTPVTTIRGYAELHRVGGLRDPDELDDAMRRTEQEAMRMSRLVEDLLALARFDEARPLRLEPVDLAVLVRDAVADARAAAPDREVVAGVAAAVVVPADPDRLRQVLANLVGNALVHTTPPAVIRVAARSDAEGGALVVGDDGDGMAAADAERATERFFRADPARARARGGTGLGLSIVEAIAAAHGGRVEIDSAPGIGTTVTVVLPGPAG
jgi:two-component system, OmpR family, sensor kinase